MRYWSMAAVASVVMLNAAPASASYVINVQEVDAGVLVLGSGSVDTSGLMLLTTASFDFDISPRLGIIVVGQSRAADFYGLIDSPQSSFGFGNLLKADVSTGAKVGLGLSEQAIRLPVGYVSRTELGVSSSVFFGATFASLGIMPSNLTIRLGTSNDTIRVLFSPELSPSAVPEPTSWSMMILGLGMIGSVFRYRRGTTMAAYARRHSQPKAA